MATLTELKARIAAEMDRGDIGSGGESEDRLDEALASAIESHSDEQFWFNRANGSGNTTASTATISLPSDVRVPSVVAYSGQALQQVPLSSIEHLTDTGIPSKWAENEDAIQLWPIPDGVYSISVYGLADTGVPDEGSSSNIWTTEAADLIVATTKKRLWRSVYRDVEGALLAQGEEEEALTRLRRESRRRGRANLTTDLPVPSTFNIVTG